MDALNLTQSGQVADAWAEIQFCEVVMRKQFYSGIIAAGVSMAAALPAYADISAQEALDGLVGYYKSFGYDVNVEMEGAEGGLLTISKLSVTFEIPDEDGSVIISTGPFTLNETGDGVVDIILPSSSTPQVLVVEDGETIASVDLTMDIVGFDGQISGEPNDVRIVNSFSMMDISVSSVNVEGNDFPLTAILKLGSLTSDYRVETADDEHRTIESIADIGSIEITLNAKNPGGDGFLSLNADMHDLKSNGFVSMMALGNMMEVLEQNPMAIFSNGFAIDGVFEFGASHLDVTFQDDGTSFSLDTNSTGGMLDAEITKDVIAYTISQEGVDLHLTSSDLPIPAVKLNYDELSFAFSIPLAQSDTPSDFHFASALRNLEVSEAIWSMVDPGQSIPRDPATVAIDVSGKVKVLVDILNMETLESLDEGGMPPMLPVSASLNELLVSFGGAELTGSGAATIDLENGGLIGGLPAPIGSIDLSLIGGFGLMDKISAIGLIPSDASLFVRGMVGAFAKPMGEDHFETTIEFVEGGGILANGQKIK